VRTCKQEGDQPPPHLMTPLYSLPLPPFSLVLRQRDGKGAFLRQGHTHVCVVLAVFVFIAALCECTPLSPSPFLFPLGACRRVCV
jgi:hypothetical protein